MTGTLTNSWEEQRTRDLPYPSFKKQFLIMTLYQWLPNFFLSRRTYERAKIIRRTSSNEYKFGSTVSIHRDSVKIRKTSEIFSWYLSRILFCIHLLYYQNAFSTWLTPFQLPTITSNRTNVLVPEAQFSRWRQEEFFRPMKLSQKSNQSVIIAACTACGLLFGCQTNLKWRSQELYSLPQDEANVL